MNMRARNVVWLLPFFLTSCSLFHRAQQRPIQALAPAEGTPKPTPTHPELPASANTLPTQPLATDNAVEQEQVPPARHRKPAKPVQQAGNNPPGTSSDDSPNGESVGVPAIGVLTSGGPADRRQGTLDSIAETERGLSQLNRNLSDQEKKTVIQIKEYLKQARQAFASGDMDGAYTLAAKAKAVFSELSQ
jgi:hypothetical protein